MTMIKINPNVVSRTKENFLPVLRNHIQSVQMPVKAGDYLEPLDAVVSAKFLKSLMNCEHIAGKSFLLDRITKKKVPVYVTKFEHQNKKYLYLKDENTSKLGHLVLEHPQRGCFKAPVGDDYIYNSMEMTELESINKGHKLSSYRGIGLELFKFAVKESKKSGYNGRIHLMAYNSVPPTPFYYKIGLRFVDDSKNKLMDDFIKLSKSSQADLPESIRQGLMYLPDENIDKLLNL